MASLFLMSSGGTLESESCSVVSDSLQPHRLYSPWNSPGQNTGVGSLSLLQGIFLTQGSNTGLPHCRQIPYQLSHKGSPRILEWVDYPFSRRYSQPRNWTRVSCIAGGFFTNWVIREASVREECNCAVVWTFFGIWKFFALLWDWNENWIFSSPVTTAEFSKFASILTGALPQHHLLGFEIVQLEFHHFH